jgi:hypothetical protein
MINEQQQAVVLSFIPMVAVQNPSMTFESSNGFICDEWMDSFENSFFVCLILDPFSHRFVREMCI